MKLNFGKITNETGYFHRAGLQAAHGFHGGTAVLSPGVADVKKPACSAGGKHVEVEPLV